MTTEVRNLVHGHSEPERSEKSAVPKLRAVPRIVQMVLGVLLLIAGIQKAADASALLRVLEYDHVPHSMRESLALVIVSWEILLGQSLILGWGGRLVSWLTVLTLVVYCAQLGLLLGSAKAPDCACLKLWDQYRTARTSNLIGLIRNGALLAGAFYVYRAQRFT